MDREITEREDKIKKLCELANKVLDASKRVSDRAIRVSMMMNWFKKNYVEIYKYIDSVLEYPKDAPSGFFELAEIFEGFVEENLRNFEQMIDLLRIENTPV